jgi:hypothetical protein
MQGFRRVAICGLASPGDWLRRSHAAVGHLAGKVHGFGFPMICFSTARDPVTGATRSKEAGWHDGFERRRSPRLQVRWTLYLTSDSITHPLRAETSEINSDSFYCLLDRPMRPGERIQCDIVVPTHNPEDPDDVVYLRCSGQALRVEKIGGAEFGLECRIEDYYVIHGAREG